MSGEHDITHMRRALDLAEEGWGHVAPNPMVGAVVVRDGTVVGEGYHAEWGGVHAEVAALEAAGELARRAALYVTLEPCRHEGKRGPCTHAILEAGIKRLVYAVADANPDAAGGAAWLRSQGLQVETGVCEDEARALNVHHLTSFGRDRPFVTLKYAMSLDARLAAAPGRTTRLTSGAAIQAAHRLRAGHDAVMVGIGTAVADDPELTVREWRAPRRPPVRVVLDSRLRLSAESKLALSAREVPVWVFAGADASWRRESCLAESGVKVLRVRRDSEGGGLDLSEALAALWAHDIRSVLCEGGGRLGSALLAAGLVDRFYAFIAPRVLGEPGVLAFQGREGEREWHIVDRENLGEVTLLVMSLAGESSSH